MYKIRFTQSYKKNYRAIIKRGLDTAPLDEVVYKLENGIPLEAARKDHALKGELNGLRECHVRSDWLLVYTIQEEYVTLVLIGTGTHSDIFG